MTYNLGDPVRIEFHLHTEEPWIVPGESNAVVADIVSKGYVVRYGCEIWIVKRENIWLVGDRPEFMWWRSL